MAFATLGGGAQGAELFVAPSGNDTSVGTRERPFATLARARDAVRELRKAAPGQAVSVTVRGGLYRLTETLALALGAEDGGTEARRWSGRPRRVRACDCWAGHA